MKQLILLFVLFLTSCISQNEMALSSNVYKMDIDARGLISMSIAKESAELRAATLTVSKGYTHYLIADARTAEGSEYLGRTPVYGNTNVNVYGNTAYATTSVYGGQPIVQPKSHTSIIVVMYRSPNIPPNAIDAKKIIEHQKKKNS